MAVEEPVDMTRDQGLEGAIRKLRAALRAAAWADHELTVALVREERDACDKWLAHIEEVPTSPSPASTQALPRAHKTLEQGVP